MSKIGKNSIQLPEGASFTFENNILSIKGKQGNANLQISNLFKMVVIILIVLINVSSFWIPGISIFPVLNTFTWNSL